MVTLLLGFFNLIRHDDRRRKTCNNGIIQRKEKVNWRKEETGRKGENKGKE